MAGSSLFALIDDIASLLDDVAAMTKVATKKTAGVLGDDLALNAQQVSGIQPDRELPVVWAVAKGSLLNKVILVPAAMAISALEAWLHGRGWNVPLITPLLMLGGAFLCYEGMEKLAHKFLHRQPDAAPAQASQPPAAQDPPVDAAAFERQRIGGAIRTDFILSAEIIVISLGTLTGRSLTEQALTLVAISLIMTVGVYGLVGGIVKLDDAGLALNRDTRDLAWARSKRALGRGILRSAPWLMKFLSIAGTAAMFLVGGQILVHGIGFLHHLIQPYSQGMLGGLVAMLFNAGVGMLAGSLVLALTMTVTHLRGKTPT